MTMITAHSGADGLPDNSREYLRHALASAADAFEIDVRRDESGALRLGHDAADGALPSLEEVFTLLAASPRPQRVNCDLKEPGLEEDVCALARAHGLAGRVILTGSADPALYAASPALRETAELWLNAEEAVADLYARAADPASRARAAEELAAVCQRCGVTTVNMNYRLAAEDFTAPLEKAGLALSLWTVNEPEDLRRFLARGVRSVTTRALAAALAAAGR